MDEEGFPIMNVERREGGQVPSLSRCLESGEVAYYQIQVLRRPPDPFEESPSESPRKRSSRISGRGDLALRDAPRFSYSKKRHFKIDQSLFYGYEDLEPAISHRALRVEMNLSPLEHDFRDVGSILHVPANFGCLCNDPLCPTAASPPSEVSSKEGRSEGYCRLPSPLSAEKPKEKRKEIQVSIWKELLFGEDVFDKEEKEWNELLLEYRPCALLKHVPLSLFRLLQLLFVIIRFCVPAISLTGFYYHRLYRHLQIHRVGDQRGVEPIFTGKVYHGPIIYGVRMMTCPYCREKSASKLSLKYFESTYRERKEAAMR